MRFAVTLFAALALSAAPVDDIFTRKAPARAERLSETAVWDVSQFAAQPDIARFDNQWLIAFREAGSPTANDGAIRIVSSFDGVKFTTAARLDHAIADFAHPRLHTLPNGRLLLTAQVTMHADGPSRHRTYAWLSWDSRMWEGPQVIGDEGIHLGAISWSRGKAYAFGHQPAARQSTLRGYMADTDLDLAPSSPATLASAQLLHAGAIFLPDDTAVALAEHADGRLHMALSRPPYKHWDWRALETPSTPTIPAKPIEATNPRVIRLPDGRLLATAADPQGRPALYWLDHSAHTLQQITALSAQSTTDSPAALSYDGSLWTTYRAQSPAGRSAIYLARIKLP